VLVRFFLAVAVFILGLAVGNSMILRMEFRLGLTLMGFALAAAVYAYREASVLGFEGAILRILAGCWVVALLGSNAALTAINYLHHRKRT